MFRVFKHNKRPEYRLIIPREAELPDALQDVSAGLKLVYTPFTS